MKQDTVTQDTPKQGTESSKDAQAASAAPLPLSKLCGFSIDVDSIASHLRGYGVRHSTYEDQHFRLAIPRSMEIFARHNIKATYFLIAEEARRAPEIVKSIVSNGHEIASHSMTHTLPFKAEDSEIFESKKVLEDLSGTVVRGFRAPSWDHSPDFYGRLAAAGYTYDSSVFPSWMLILYRMSIKRRAVGDGAQVEIPQLRELFDTPIPHFVNGDGSRLTEFPVSTARIIRVPWYHTINYLLPAPLFSLVQWLTLVRPGPVQYVFHAVDFLGLEEDSVDPRLRVHPGMEYPLKEKLERIDRVLRSIRAKREGITLADISARVRW